MLRRDHEKSMKKMRKIKQDFKRLVQGDPIDQLSDDDSSENAQNDQIKKRSLLEALRSSGMVTSLSFVKTLNPLARWSEQRLRRQEMLNSSYAQDCMLLKTDKGIPVINDSPREQPTRQEAAQQSPSRSIIITSISCEYPILLL